MSLHILELQHKVMPGHFFLSKLQGLLTVTETHFTSLNVPEEESFNRTFVFLITSLVAGFLQQLLIRVQTIK
jgi:hypothetical protein